MEEVWLALGLSIRVAMLATLLAMCAALPLAALTAFIVLSSSSGVEILVCAATIVPANSSIPAATYVFTPRIHPPEKEQ